MKSSLLYRIAAILLVLFAVGHTLGFRQVDPKWGADSLVASMRAVHFDVQGFSRSYWDFYTGFGMFVTVFFLFSAFLAWQLGSLSAQSLSAMRGITWGFALCFVAVTILNWGYFFVVPVVFSAVVTVCLIAAAWRLAKPL